MNLILPYLSDHNPLLAYSHPGNYKTDVLEKRNRYLNIDQMLVGYHPKVFAQCIYDYMVRLNIRLSTENHYPQRFYTHSV